MKQTLTILAQVRAKPGMEAAMIAAQERLVAVTVSSPGCLRYELHRSNSDAGAVAFIEEWASREAWLAHMNSDYMEAFRATGGNAIGEFALQEMHRIA